MTTLQECYIKEQSIVARRIENEFILVPIHTKTGDMDSVYTLNEVSARIWDLIDGKSTVESIVEKIIDEYDVEKAVAMQDILEYFDQLKQIGAARKV